MNYELQVTMNPNDVWCSDFDGSAYDPYFEEYDIDSNDQNGLVQTFTVGEGG
jgi:hypothetical protein